MVAPPLDLQLAVMTPERSKFAQEFMTKLLLWTGEPKSLLMLSKGEGYECAWWNARLRDRVAGWFADREREAKLLQILNREGAEVDEGDGTQDIQIFILEQTRLYAGKLPSEEKLERSLALWDITLSPLGQTNPLQVGKQETSLSFPNPHAYCPLTFIPNVPARIDTAFVHTCEHSVMLLNTLRRIAISRIWG